MVNSLVTVALSLNHFCETHGPNLVFCTQLLPFGSSLYDLSELCLDKGVAEEDDQRNEALPVDDGHEEESPPELPTDEDPLDVEEMITQLSTG